MRVLVRLLTAVALSFVLGFVLFVLNLPRETTGDIDMTEIADLSRDKVGIVIFTGGNGERIERGLKLYETGAAERILISGTHPDVRKADLASTGDRTIIECCVDLGFKAQTTIGNALEAKEWARDQGYDAVILVTSEFHMPRAVVELRHAAPHLEIVSAPVASRLVPADGWATSPKAWNILGREYVKFILAYIRSLS